MSKKFLALSLFAVSTVAAQDKPKHLSLAEMEEYTEKTTECLSFMSDRLICSPTESVSCSPLHLEKILKKIDSIANAIEKTVKKNVPSAQINEELNNLKKIVSYFYLLNTTRCTNFILDTQKNISFFKQIKKLNHLFKTTNAQDSGYIYCGLFAACLEINKALTTIEQKASTEQKNLIKKCLLILSDYTFLNELIINHWGENITPEQLKSMRSQLRPESPFLNDEMQLQGLGLEYLYSTCFNQDEQSMLTTLFQEYTENLDKNFYIDRFLHDFTPLAKPEFNIDYLIISETDKIGFSFDKKTLYTDLPTTIVASDSPHCEIKIIKNIFNKPVRIAVSENVIVKSNAALLDKIIAHQNALKLIFHADENLAAETLTTVDETYTFLWKNYPCKTFSKCEFSNYTLVTNQTPEEPATSE
ncbi:hypothetical protein FJ366_02185 [Candidatus Dependentiae bacterium]|nr:hypothetical protein [Candidatus Dependentiae bacterium]